MFPFTTIFEHNVKHRLLNYERDRRWFPNIKYSTFKSCTSFGLVSYNNKLYVYDFFTILLDRFKVCIQIRGI